MKIEEMYKLGRKVLSDLNVSSTNPNYEDYLQEMVIKANKAECDKENEAKESTFLYKVMRIAYYEIVRNNNYKKRDSRKTIIDNEAVNAASVESSVVEDSIETEIMSFIKNNISDEFYRAIFKHETITDIAKDGGITVQGMRSRFATEFKKLQKAIESRKDYEDIKKIILRKINGE